MKSVLQCFPGILWLWFCVVEFITQGKILIVYREEAFGKALVVTKERSIKMPNISVSKWHWLWLLPGNTSPFHSFPVLFSVPNSWLSRNDEIYPVSCATGNSSKWPGPLQQPLQILTYSGQNNKLVKLQ